MSLETCFRFQVDIDQDQAVIYRRQDHTPQRKSFSRTGGIQLLISLLLDQSHTRATQKVRSYPPPVRVHIVQSTVGSRLQLEIHASPSALVRLNLDFLKAHILTNEWVHRFVQAFLETESQQDFFFCRNPLHCRPHKNDLRNQK